MKRYEKRIVNGHIVRKEAHPLHRNRDGYAKTCYAIYETEEQMNNCTPIARCYLMKEVNEITKGD